MKVQSRFSYFRDKLQVFFLGFLMGIVLGGGFFVLKLDQYVKELSFYKSLTEREPQPEHELFDREQEKETRPKKKPSKKTVPVAETPGTDTTDLVAAGDTSLPSVFDTDNTDDIVIRKDELLGQKSVALVDLNRLPGDTASANAYFTVEFWRSPLNYTGYKFSRTRLVLFGFSQDDVSAMYRLENETFFKTANGVFRIEPATNFRQPERVTDEALIAQMQ